MKMYFKNVLGHPDVLRSQLNATKRRRLISWEHKIGCFESLFEQFK